MTSTTTSEFCDNRYFSGFTEPGEKLGQHHLKAEEWLRHVVDRRYKCKWDGDPPNPKGKAGPQHAAVYLTGQARSWWENGYVMNRNKNYGKRNKEMTWEDFVAEFSLTYGVSVKTTDCLASLAACRTQRQNEGAEAYLYRCIETYARLLHTLDVVNELDVNVFFAEQGINKDTPFDQIVKATEMFGVASRTGGFNHLGRRLVVNQVCEGTINPHIRRRATDLAKLHPDTDEFNAAFVEMARQEERNSGRTGTKARPHTIAAVAPPAETVTEDESPTVEAVNNKQKKQKKKKPKAKASAASSSKSPAVCDFCAHPGHHVKDCRIKKGIASRKGDASAANAAAAVQEDVSFMATTWSGNA